MPQSTATPSTRTVKIMPSPSLPVVTRSDRTGGNPILTGNGKNHGTPSFVKLSITRCDNMPTINAHHTMFMSILGIMG